MASVETMNVNVRMNFENTSLIRRGMHVSSLVSGFSGLVVQERHYLHGSSKMLVAPAARIGKRPRKERWINVRQLRVDAPIRRKNAPVSTTVRYAHDAQEPIVDALFDFAENLRVRPTQGIMAQRPGNLVGVSLEHVATALDQILAGLGYVKVGE